MLSHHNSLLEPLQMGEQLIGVLPAGSICSVRAEFSCIANCGINDQMGFRYWPCDAPIARPRRSDHIEACTDLHWRERRETRLGSIDPPELNVLDVKLSLPFIKLWFTYNEVSYNRDLVAPRHTGRHE